MKFHQDVCFKFPCRIILITLIAYYKGEKSIHWAHTYILLLFPGFVQTLQQNDGGFKFVSWTQTPTFTEIMWDCINKKKKMEFDVRYHSYPGWSLLYSPCNIPYIWYPFFIKLLFLTLYEVSPVSILSRLTKAGFPER
jgi:hypothetical protein